MSFFLYLHISYTVTKNFLYMELEKLVQKLFEAITQLTILVKGYSEKIDAIAQGTATHWQKKGVEIHDSQEVTINTAGSEAELVYECKTGADVLTAIQISVMNGAEDVAYYRTRVEFKDEKTTYWYKNKPLQHLLSDNSKTATNWRPYYFNQRIPLGDKRKLFLTFKDVDNGVTDFTPLQLNVTFIYTQVK